MRTESQNKLIKRHLQSGKSISPLMALNKYGILRLAARCFDLKRQGMNIKSEMVYEGPYKYAKYTLIK